MRSNFLTLKIIAIIILMAIFWVGLNFISALVSERQQYQQDFLQDIAQNHIRPQSIVSPYIRVPYQENRICQNEKKEPYKCIETHWTLIGADQTHWTSQFDVSDNQYKRTIYRAISYQALLTAQGSFQKPLLEQHPYQWDQAEIVLPVSDPRGLNQNPTIKILNQNYQFEITPQDTTNSGLNFMRIGVKQRPELLNAIQNGFQFKLQVNTAGLNKFTLIPTSNVITYAAKGNWADAKYDGQSLPYKKNSAEKQFSAQWKNIALGQQNLNVLANCTANNGNNQNCLNPLKSSQYSDNEENYTAENTHEKIGLSTEFLESVNVYTQTDRAIKYGIVIILITFGCFFLFEVLKSLRIHPIQYALVAMAQGIFFVLLLAISEYYAFAWAYIVAAIACISLMTWYLFFVMKGFKAAALFGVILSILYGIMYMLLQSSGKTFLMGSVIAFIILSIVMFITRNIDWYQLNGRTERELKIYTPPQ